MVLTCWKRKKIWLAVSKRRRHHMRGKRGRQGGLSLFCAYAKDWRLVYSCVVIYNARTRCTIKCRRKNTRHTQASLSWTSRAIKTTFPTRLKKLNPHDGVRRFSPPFHLPNTISINLSARVSIGRPAWNRCHSDLMKLNARNINYHVFILFMTVRANRQSKKP